MPLEKTKYAQAINDEILEKFSLKNRYNFLNNNLNAVLSSEEFSFLREVERFCMKFEKQNNITHSTDEDIYSWVPDFGEKGYITRQHPFTECDLNYTFNKPQEKTVNVALSNAFGFGGHNSSAIFKKFTK